MNLSAAGQEATDHAWGGVSDAYQLACVVQNITKVMELVVGRMKHGGTYPTDAENLQALAFALSLLVNRND